MPIKLSDPITSPKEPAFCLDADGAMRLCDSASSMAPHIDTILFSTNGAVGVKHLLVSPYTIRSSVIVNGAYHRNLVQGNSSVAMPTFEQVGGTLCYSDISLFVDDELCSCRDYTDAALNLNTGIYSFITKARTSQYTVYLRFNRLASLSMPNVWSSEFSITGIEAHNKSVPTSSLPLKIRLVTETRCDSHSWTCSVDPSNLDSPDGLRSVEVISSVSSSSGVGVRTDIDSIIEASTYRIFADHSPVCLSGGTAGYAESSTSTFSSLDTSFQYRQTSSVSTQRDPMPDKAHPDLIQRATYNIVLAEPLVEPVVLRQTFSHAVTGTMPITSLPASVATITTAAEATQLPSYCALAEAQKGILDLFWADYEVSVILRGDAHRDRATNALKYNSFVLFCSARGCGENRGITRGGLSSGGSQSQINLQTYLFHGIYYVLTNPSMALNVIRHLYSMLPEARNAARNMAIQYGALYPQKTVTGTNCSAFSLSNCARFQINADLAHVVILYLTVESSMPLQDELMCMELLLETARMWLCVGMWHDAETVFRIDDVNGPDEYSGLTENNFYTHVAAMKHMSGAVRHFKAFNKAQSLAAAALLKHIKMPREEIDALARAADAIVLHRDDRSGVYYAHAHFDDLVEWWDETPRHPLSQNYHPAVIFRHKVVQISEVLLAMLVHPESFERADLKRNLAYYEPLCTHDHPLSMSVMATAKFSAYGDFGNGSEEFLALAQLNLDNNKVASEGLHLSWMSASWFTLAVGIGGVKVVQGSLSFRPCLPVGWEQCVFTIKWKGSTVKVSIRAEAITYELIKGCVCRFSHFDARVRLDRVTESRGKVTIPRIVYQDAGSFDGMIFSLESFFSNSDDLNLASWATVLNRYTEDCNRRAMLMGRANTAQKAFPLTRAEYVESGLCLQDRDPSSLAGLQKVLSTRGIDIPVGSQQDSETVESQYGLANAKMEEVRSMLKGFTLDPIPSMMDLLEDLSTSGIRVAIATFSTSIKFILAKCPKTLADFATTLIDGEEASEKRLRGRPTTELFVHAANKMHLEPSRCVVVGTRFGHGYDISELTRFFKVVDIVADTECITSSIGSSVKILPTSDIPSTTAQFEDWLLS